MSGFSWTGTSLAWALNVAFVLLTPAFVLSAQRKQSESTGLKNDMIAVSDNAPLGNVGEKITEQTALVDAHHE